MGKIFTPFEANLNHRHVHISDVSKKQLARAVNEQAATIQRLDESVKAMGRVLLAIARSPDALRAEIGYVVVSGLAVESVAGWTLRIDPEPNGDLRMTVAPPPSSVPTVDLPKIVLPN